MIILQLITQRDQQQIGDEYASTVASQDPSPETVSKRGSNTDGIKPCGEASQEIQNTRWSWGPPEHLDQCFGGMAPSSLRSQLHQNSSQCVIQEDVPRTLRTLLVYKRIGSMMTVNSSSLKTKGKTVINIQGRSFQVFVSDRSL